ncbi:hypothetical protein LWI29_033989 [Acer saccharum]|uniref:non-specific serine/threonine protein kinase n=1 Tax=Acer saccharum TaxID=4024 RepID=A0AA39VG96_ACESA|nr:hypothetical protein LWI29_033989 [Acer saccharum]
MRLSIGFLLLFAPILHGLSSSSELSETSLSYPNPRVSKLFSSLLTPSPLPPPPQPSSKADFGVVADWDGTISLVDSKLGEIRWSFSSGRPIYSSYQASINQNNDSEFYIDVGKDWELYWHSKRSGKVEKLPLSVEEYIRSSPYITEDGGVIVGAKNTTVFVVDAKSGTVVYTYGSVDSRSTVGFQSAEEKNVNSSKALVKSVSQNSKKVRHLVYVMRTDYELLYYSPNSEEALWNVKFAHIEAEFRCQGTENSLGRYPFELGNELTAQNFGDDELPLQCQTKVPVYQLRDNNFIGKLGGFLYPPPAVNQYPPLMLDDKTLPRAPPDSQIGNMVALLESPRMLEGGSVHEINNPSTFAEITKASYVQSIIALFISLLSIIGVFFSRSKQSKLNKQVEELKVQAGMSKKKKSRRLGNNKNNAKSEQMQKSISHESKSGDPSGPPHFEGNDKKFLLTFNNVVDGRLDGRRIGKLVVSNKEIAKGSNGTVVLEGIYDGRPVAVKRLVQTHHDVALKEIQNLIASDQHPNIVRWYGVEFDQDFVYLSLERCTCSLSDLIYVFSGSFESQEMTNYRDSNLSDEFTIRLRAIMENNKSVELWKENGHPSAQLLKLMRDMVSGVCHLHELGIIHRDVKPHNVLIKTEKSLYAKLSDMGISKRLLGDMSSLTQNATGYGSSGWQAPEQLLHGRQTRAVDIFGLGCVLFFCLTGGRHPYGDNFERDVNIVNDRKDLFLVENIPEAVDLFSHLLDPNPDMRPRAQDVLYHPLFWTSEMRLSFLRDVSDRVELEDREGDSELLKELEGIAPLALNGKWDEKMEAAFINNIGRYRRYKYDSIRDLLRVIRNKSNHYRELPQDIQELLGTIPEGFYDYFSSRFPKLLMEVYNVVYRYCNEEEFLQKYIGSDQV